jgi:predicted dehydrogenase
MASSVSHRQSRKVRYAVVGLGHIAQAAVLPAFKHAARNSQLAALVSGTPEKLASLGRRYGVQQCCDYSTADELFSSGELDAVYIALPNHLHREYAIKAARAGLHVLCEKPMAVSARDCQAMIAAAQRAKVKLMIAYRLHFERANLEASRLLRAGTLGEPRFFNSEFSMQVSANNIRVRRETGGGPLYDIGIYCINAARYCFGADPVQVWATATRSSDPRFREVDETVTAVMRFNAQRLATFTCSFGAADRSIYTVTGTRGSVTVDPAYEYAEGLAYRVKRGERVRKKSLAKSDQFAPELLYFSDCILKQREPEPAGAEGLVDVRVIEAMQRSIKTGRWVGTGVQPRKRRPTKRQDIRRPAVPREPALVQAGAGSQ